MSAGLLALAALIAGAGCTAYDGPDADPDDLVYPVGIAVHPSGDALYVLSTNFDARYNTDRGGTVAVFTRGDDGDAETDDVSTMFYRRPDQTVWIPSYGGELALGAFDADGQPRALYAVTRSNNNAIVLALSADGSELSCQPSASASATQDGNACAVDYLPADPFAIQPLPDFVEDDTTYEMVAIASLGGNVTIMAIPDLDGDGLLNPGGAIHDAIGVLSGASTMALYPPTGELYVGGRYFNGMRAVRWTVADDEVRFYVARTVGIDNAADTLEVRDIVFSEATERAYLTTDRPDSVVILDMGLDDEGVPRGTYIDRIPLTGSPSEALLVDEAGREVLYVVLSDDDAVAAIDVETRQVETLIPVGDNPFGLAISPAGDALYVTLFRDHAVATIDLDLSSPTFRHANVSGSIE